MSTSRCRLLFILGMVAAGAVLGETPNLGQPANQALIALWDISVAPDGTGLPPGHGSAAEGQTIYQAKCLGCHGEAGRGGLADQLTGGIGSLSSGHPVKTVASFWPYSTTLFDYIRRAMPVMMPQSLTNDEIYALCAYLLSIDHIIALDATLDAETLPKVKMPNRNGFVSAWPAIEQVRSPEH